MKLCLLQTEEAGGVVKEKEERKSNLNDFKTAGQPVSYV